MEFTVSYNAGSNKYPICTSVIYGFYKKSGAKLTFKSDAEDQSAAYKLNDTEYATDLAMALGLDKALGGEIPAKWVEFCEKMADTDAEAVLSELAEAVKPNIDATKRTDALVAAMLHETGKFDLRTHSKKFPAVAKWFQQMKRTPETKSAFSEYDAAAKASADTSNRAGTQGKFGLVEVPEGMVVTTRFPPEPSGFLHIGHIKAALMNEYFAHIKYKGKLLIRYDDSNPAKEKIEFYDSVLDDLAMVGIKGDSISYTSDYFDLLLTYADRIIREGNAYVDNSTREEMAYGRMHGVESPCRNNSVERNLELFEEMKKGSEIGVKCVLRGKTDMQHKNKVMRDPSLYRCIVGKTHVRTGDKYHAYPLYDFLIPIIDSIEGVTHALRSSEYHDRNELYNWIIDIFKLRRPIIEDFSRLNFAYVLLSKRKLQWFVDNGVVSGWDDPRFPTVRGLLRRGLTVEAMREFVQAQGSSKALNLMEMSKLWAINKRIIDPKIPRYTAVEDATKVPLHLSGEGAPAEPFVRSDIPKHRTNPDLGVKNVTYSSDLFIEGEDADDLHEGEEITLMDWGNVVVDTVTRDPATNHVTAVAAHMHLEGSVKDTKKKLTWLSAAAKARSINIYEYDHLITAPKIPEDANWEDYVNRNSVVVTKAIGSPDLAEVKKGESLQLERRGYFICDKQTDDATDLIMIPDGSSRKLLGQKILMKWK